MSHRSVAESIEQDRARAATLAATGSNAFSVMMGASPKQQKSRAKDTASICGWALALVVHCSRGCNVHMLCMGCSNGLSWG